MIGEDRDVLEFLGQKGKSPEEIGERFPGFDMLRLVRAGLVEEQHIELAETQAHGDMSPSFIRHYMLTERGARAVGIDPLRLGLAWPSLEARIGELVGHGDIVTTARTYTHVLADEAELDYERML